MKTLLYGLNWQKFRAVKYSLMTKILTLKPLELLYALQCLGGVKYELTEEAKTTLRKGFQSSAEAT